MFKILVSRTVEAKAPFKLYYDLNQDWTHFSHLHRKAIVSHRLLFKDDKREIFLYKARRLYPFPFYDDYIVFREDVPSQNGYRNVYVNTKSGHVHTVEVKLESQGDRTLMVGDHLFSLPSYWRFLPKFFLRIFLWVYRWRMDQILDEDHGLIYESMKMGCPPTDDSCAPVIPETYDVLDVFFKKEATEVADAYFQYRVVENFDGKGRLRLKEKS